MTDLTFDAAQADMRRGYLSGAPGVLVSGLVWLVAGVVAVAGSDIAAVLALLAGGALIHPLSILLIKSLGRTGAHASGNPLGRLAGETTVALVVGLVIAFAVSSVQVEWFFPTVLLIIGGRYLVFQTVYGLRSYWMLGAALCLTGFALGYLRVPVFIGAFAGAIIEFVAGAAIWVQVQRSEAA
jgi:hypothetical protein